MTYWLNVYDACGSKWIGGPCQSVGDALYDEWMVGIAGGRTLYRIKVRLKRAAP